MSGVVVKLNDDEEEEEEDEDDTGLLSSRGYDDDDDDDDDDIVRGHRIGAGGVFKKLRGDKKMPHSYHSIRSGTVMQLLNTLTICCIFFGMVN